MKKVVPVAISLALLVAAAVIVVGKGKPPSLQDVLTCTGIQGDIKSDPFTMKGTYEGGSWTSTKLCRIWPEKGDARAIFTYPNDVSESGQIWQLDRDQLMNDPRCGLNILMDDGKHYRVLQLASKGLVMYYNKAEDSWFFQFNKAQLWSSDGYVAEVTFELTVKRT